MHENLTREPQFETSSNRTFGFVFIVVFAVIAMWPLLSAGRLR